MGAGAVAAAGAVAGAAISAKGASKAGKQAAAGQYASIEEQRRQFDITQEQMAPYREAGLRGLEKYEEMLGQITPEFVKKWMPDTEPPEFKFGKEEFEQYKDPGYEFRLSEGMRGLNRGLARGGMLRSGGRLRALQTLGQEMGSQEFGAARGRAMEDYTTQVAREEEMRRRGLDLYSLAFQQPMAGYGGLFGAGQQATQNLASLRAGMAQNIGQSMGAAAEARAAGTLGKYGAIGSGLSSLGNVYQQFGGGMPSLGTSAGSQFGGASNVWGNYGGGGYGGGMGA